MDKLGIQPTQLLAQVLNFLILIFILSKLLYKPILKVLSDRKKKIEEGFRYTDEMKSEMEKQVKKREEIIAKAKIEAKKIIEESKKTGKALEAEIVNKAHETAGAIIEKAKKDLDVERLVMQKQLKAQTVEVASTWVEAVLGQVIDTKTQESIINKKLKDLANLSK